MQPVFVEPAIPDDRVARKKLFLAENLGKPQRHQQRLTQQRSHRAFGPPNPNRLVDGTVLRCRKASHQTGSAESLLRRVARPAFASTKTDPPILRMIKGASATSILQPESCPDRPPCPRFSSTTLACSVHQLFRNVAQAQFRSL